MNKNTLKIMSVICALVLLISVSSCVLHKSAKSKNEIVDVWVYNGDDLSSRVVMDFQEETLYIYSLTEGEEATNEFNYEAKDGEITIYQDKTPVLTWLYKIKGDSLFIFKEESGKKLEFIRANELEESTEEQKFSESKTKSTTKKKAKRTTERTTETTTTATAIEFELFSEKYNVTPMLEYGITEMYDSKVSKEEIYEYISYLESCGYKRNASAEKMLKDNEDEKYVLDGKISNDNITITIYGNIKTISYLKFYEEEEETTNQKANNDYESRVKTTAAQTTKYKTSCPICGGAGWVQCPDCGGTGYKTRTRYSSDYGSGSVTYQDQIRCPRCSKNKGKVRCKCGGVWL